MFSVAVWLDSVKAKAGISSDYGLAKLIEKNQSLITNYRAGRSMPEAEIVMKLCELSGDDPAVILAQIQAARAQDGKARSLWESIAQRLQHGGALVGQMAMAAILLVALYPHDTSAKGQNDHEAQAPSSYYVKSLSDYGPLVLLFGLLLFLARLRPF